MRKQEQNIIFLLVLGVPALIIFGIVSAIGFPLFLVLITIVIALIIWYFDKKKKERIAYINKKYNDPKIAEDIINGLFWQGQTSEQLIDSIGKPSDIDQKILKTKKKEVWKYNPDGRNRFRLRIILENDVVIGWKKR